ncbi:MAG: alanine racemase, partial [Microbacterium sp.]|uniref:alanine racemase n=1 Tax=Microbacterium sp. TaxID=51671 RepID=UPI0039E711E2
ARAALDGGADRLGVADVGEAIALRRAGVTAPILAWLHDPEESFDEAASLGVELGVSSFEQLQRAAATASSRPTSVHLKLETGLSRNGIPPADWGLVFAEAARLERIGKLAVTGLFSHLSNASADDDRAALRRFERGVIAAASAGLTPPLRHLAATHAAIALPESRLGCVRIGIGLYGLSPFDDRSSADLGLQPAMTLRGRVAAVRRVPAGAGVSYGHDYRAGRETTLALVPLGYYDGVPRAVSGRAPVSIGGRRFTIAGRVAMDQFVVDVGDHPVAVGDEAVLFGDPTLGVPSADEWADAAGTINYEIVTRVGPRVVRTEAPA